MDAMKQRWTSAVFLFAVVAGTGCGSDSSRGDAMLADAAADAAEAPDTSKVDASKPDASKPDASKPESDAGDAGMQTGTPANSCSSLKCTAPATCSESDGKAHCTCPAGYDDKKGDGSQCDDKDECAKSEDNNCGKHAKCENKPGSFSCTCQAPAYKGDGKSCECADGYVETDGACVANDGGRCEDNLDCMHGHCQSGICCAQACSNPGAECLSVEKATCEDGHTCKYPVSEDGATCDDADACTTKSSCQSGNCIKGTVDVDCNDSNPCTDDACDAVLGCKNPSNTATCDDGNPCTENDTCMGGTCSNTTPKNCAVQTDTCNLGVCDPSNGSCVKMALANGTTCTDANSCTANDVCTNGVCGGPNACGPNATACTPGAPNTCSCAVGFKPGAGECVPDTNECSTSPCSPDAICFDPSNNPGDVQCTCKPGYDGDGRTCIEHNGCANNPCGNGTCVRGTAGAYSCTCAEGFTEVNGQCVCNLGGTFAIRLAVHSTWVAQTGFEKGDAMSFTWSLGKFVYDTQGNLTMNLSTCGETNVDLCGTGVGGLVPVEAYAQYVPLAVWEKIAAGSPAVVQMSLPAALPNTPFKSPLTAALNGIALTDPLGAWPATYKDIQGGPDYDGSAINGARWLDTDADGVAGLTTFTVGPGGAAADGSPSAPAEAYGPTSQACPRDTPSAPRSSYNYPPAADGLTLRRVKRFSSANRMISGFDGKLDTCQRISGTVFGPDDGRPHFDARVGSCVRVNGAAETACSSAVVSASDSSAKGNGDTQTATFVMKRAADTTTCAQVRALSFD
jgi:hypothetical protein